MRWITYRSIRYWVAEHRKLGPLLFEPSACLLPHGWADGSRVVGGLRVALYVVSDFEYRLFDRATVRTKFYSKAEFDAKYKDPFADFEAWAFKARLRAGEAEAMIHACCATDLEASADLDCLDGDDGYYGFEPSQTESSGGSTRAYDRATDQHNIGTNYTLD